MTGDLLAATLDLAVPLLVAEFRLVGKPDEDDFAWARGFAWVLGSQGDNLLYRSATAGETARLFNDLARAVAIMAHVPGGIFVFGRRWEASGADGQPDAVPGR